MDQLTRRGFLLATSSLLLGTALPAMYGCDGPKNDPQPRQTEADAQGTGVSQPTPTPDPEPTPILSESPVDERYARYRSALASMTLEQKVAQLFILTPEQIASRSPVLSFDDDLARAYASRPVGGFALFGGNISSAQQFDALVADARRSCTLACNGIPPFLAVDEEGGSLVARLAKSGVFPEIEPVPDAWSIGATGDPAQARYYASYIGSYLAAHGLNVDFAPCADVLVRPDNYVIGTRSFSSDPYLDSQMVAAQVEGFTEQGILSCAKHFPGHGATEADSHYGMAPTYRSAQEIASCELLPFQAAIEAGVPMIMVGHISVPSIIGDDLPASLSGVVIGQMLRENMGYDGIIISDSFQMEAITSRFTSADAAAAFIIAGGDIVLMPNNFEGAYQGVLDAVASGLITEQRIQESLERIIRAKSRIADL